MSEPLADLTDALIAAGLPISGIRSDKSPVWSTNPTPYQETQAVAIISTFDLRQRKPRLLNSILVDLLGLTNSQQNALWSDFTSGSPPKWRRTTNDRGIWALAATNPGTQIARGVAIAMYILDNPKWAVNPSFDPTINVPGDQLA